MSSSSKVDKIVSITSSSNELKLLGAILYVSMDSSAASRGVASDVVGFGRIFFADSGRTALESTEAALSSSLSSSENEGSLNGFSKVPVTKFPDVRRFWWSVLYTTTSCLLFKI